MAPIIHWHGWVGIQGYFITSTFRRNKGSDEGYGQGGGIVVLGHHEVEVDGCHFQDNDAYAGPGIHGGFLTDAATPVAVSNPNFCRNFFHDYSLDAIDDNGGNNFERTCWCSSDIDLDRFVGVNDLLIVIDSWGRQCDDNS